MTKFLTLAAIMSASMAATLALAQSPTSTIAPHEITEPPPERTLVGNIYEGTPDVDEAIIDKTVNPCDDFYRYACGGWLAKTQIPEDRSRWARGFSVIDEQNKETLKQILEDYAAGKKTPDVPYTQMLGDFYAACMDENSAEHGSLKVLKGYLQEIDALKDISGLPALIGDLHKESVDPLFSDGPEVDSKDPDKMIYFVDQGGIGLPDREYYLSKDKKKEEIRGQYVKHIAKVLELAGTPKKKAKSDAKKIMELETQLAQISMDRVARRDPKAVYHRLELKGLKEKSPAIDWDVYLKTIGYPSITEIDVKVPDFFSGLNALLGNVPLEDLKTYMRYEFIDGASPALAKAFVDEHFNFYEHTLSGQKKLQPRWKRCVTTADQLVGFALAHAFVDKTFGKEGKEISQGMVDGIEKTFAGDLKKLPWMDDATKSMAFKKLKRVVNKIGYPDKWRNYDGLNISRDSYLKNRVEASLFLFKYYLDKIGKPVDRNEWEMTPPTVNAYYDAQFNQMVFPAGILQRPFFDRHSGAPANFGGIGMVMGHELTHGYDDEGRQYDDTGALKDWWSPTSAKEFDSRTQCLVDKYGQYTVQKDLHVNGKLTLGENIADQGGMKLSYETWKALAEKKGEAGLDFEKKYFLAFAQSWCMKVQPEAERMLITVDYHSPGPVRVDGTLSNFKPFAQAYDCKEGMTMAPKNRCEIW